MKNLKQVVLVLVISVICFGFLNANAFAEGEEEKPEISDAQRTTIVDHCDTIKDMLKSLQKVDSRTRVYLGRYFETILTNFITPLNLRLVENNISNSKLLENQTNFANKRISFVNDFIIYQQNLEELIRINCKTEPDKFYETLLTVREKRNAVNKDVAKLKAMTTEQMKLVEELMNGE